MASNTGPVALPELLVELDRTSDLPLHEQLESALRERIRSGGLPAGARLPSTRGFAMELGVSRGVVTECYAQLASEGYIETRQGASVRVARGIRAASQRAPASSLLPSFPYHFHPGLPDLAGFPRESWLRSVRTVWRDAPLDAVGYGDPRGAPSTRETLGAYLARARGAEADPERTLICSGFMQSFSLLCRWLQANGVQRIAVEDPGWMVHRLIAEQAGLEPVPVPVDADGLDVSELRMSGASAAILTPAHQFPTGVVLSGERRSALIDWAEDGDCLVIEDDFDAEFRYDRGAVGAIQGLAPERVVYIGSASKRLAPGMRLGWMLVPSWLAWPLVSLKAVEDGGSEAVSQLALADFIARGELDRHMRRMRLRYERRRHTLLDALARWLPQARPSRSAAGLYDLVELPEGIEETPLLAAAADRGVGIEPLSWHRLASTGTPGVLLGYANLSEPAIDRGVRLLAEAVAEIAF
ncbi:MAG TPA: PLP-dependent aminotransferase family protein [Solirubrobacteraceae bacterium]|jgi:GntR family transcriptional regulator/MocR family aminotransferase